MNRRIRRLSGLVVALVLSTAALATATAGAGGGAAEEPGLTADSMNVVLLYGDTAPLEQAGILAKIGDRLQHFQVFADAANEAGGAAGRQLNVTNKTYPVPGTPTDERTACLAATEDDDAFVVVFAGNQTEETILCVTDEHERIALAVAANASPSAYKGSSGRLFTNDPSTTRLMKMWVKALKKNGTLKGATIGIVRPDDTSHEAVGEVLTKELDKAGFEVTENVALPCAGLEACEQNEVGAERLQTKGVDTVFTLLNALANPAFVGAADSIGYRPQYVGSDYEYQVYDTTANLFGDTKAAYDGAIGLSTSIKETEPDAPRTECNATFTEVTGIEAEPLTDEWRDVGTMCGMVDRIVKAADAAEAAGGLTQESFIEEYEKFTIAEGERKGAWSPKKHDAYNTYQLYKFSAACTCWESIPGTEGTSK